MENEIKRFLEPTDYLRKKINHCKKIKLEDVRLEDVDDINDIKIDRRKSSQERMIDYLKKVKNPYIFKINGRLVQISFSNSNKTADDCLSNVLKNLYK